MRQIYAGREGGEVGDPSVGGVEPLEEGAAGQGYQIEDLVAALNGEEAE